MDAVLMRGKGSHLLVPVYSLIVGMATSWTVRAEGELVTLHETRGPEACTQTRIELKAEGLFRPGLSPGETTPEASLPRPLALDVKTRLIYAERLLASPPADPKGSGVKAHPRAARWVEQAASAINGEVRPTRQVLRSGLSLLIAERNDQDGVVVVSPAGPMTRSELELVQGVGDPLALIDLLPSGAVAKGDSWKLPASAVVALTDYDTITQNKVQATLEQLDEKSARIRLKGDVRGSVHGGDGTISCEGFATFDRQAGLLDRLELNRTENRQPGPIEAGLEVKSTLTVTRRLIRMAPELTDAALANVTRETTGPRQLLQLVAPDGKYNLLHDRAWHTFWGNPKLIVLKRLEKGRVVAHCKLAAGPSVGKGKHQDLTQFRDDIKRSLEGRFGQFLGAGEVDGDPLGGFRYKVGVEGRQGELGVLWSYFLVASPEGDQLLATFTIAQSDAAAFGDQDLELIGSLQWAPTEMAQKP